MTKVWMIQHTIYSQDFQITSAATRFFGKLLWLVLCSYCADMKEVMMGEEKAWWGFFVFCEFLLLQSDTLYMIAADVCWWSSCFGGKSVPQEMFIVFKSCSLQRSYLPVRTGTSVKHGWMDTVRYGSRWWWWCYRTRTICFLSARMKASSLKMQYRYFIFESILNINLEVPIRFH